MSHSLAKTFSLVAPQLAEAYLSTLPPGETREQVREVIHEAIHQMQDAVLGQERQQAAMRLAGCATDLLRGWPGEPSIESARQAVEIANELLKHAHRVAAKG